MADNVNRDTLDLQEINISGTLKELVEKVNYNFEQIASHGGGPAGVDGESSIIPGPAGKRGSGIHVIVDESGESDTEVDEVGVSYEADVNAALDYDASPDGEGKYKDGDCIIYKSYLYTVSKSGNSLVSECVGSLKGEKGNDGKNGQDANGESIVSLTSIGDSMDALGYQLSSDRGYMVIGNISENELDNYGGSDYDRIYHGNHVLWILDGSKGIALCEENTDDMSTITYKDGGLILSGNDSISLYADSVGTSASVAVLSSDTTSVNAKNVNVNLSGSSEMKIEGINSKLSVSNASIDCNAGTVSVSSTGDMSLSGNDVNLSASGHALVNGDSVTLLGNANSAAINEDFGKIVVDEFSVAVSGDGLSMTTHSGKGLSVGASSLAGYDNDIYGKTYIDGDLVVSGAIQGSTKYSVGDMILIEQYSSYPEGGWFDNTDLLRVYNLPYVKTSSGAYVEYSNDTKSLSYLDLKTYNVDDNIPVFNNESEFNKYSSIAKFLHKKYNGNLYWSTSMMQYGINVTGDKLDDVILMNEYENYPSYDEDMYDYRTYYMCDNTIYGYGKGNAIRSSSNSIAPASYVIFALDPEIADIGFFVKSGAIPVMEGILGGAVDKIYAYNASYYDATITTGVATITDNINTMLADYSDRLYCEGIYVDGDVNKVFFIIFGMGTSAYKASVTNLKDRYRFYVNNEFSLPSNSGSFKYIMKYSDDSSSSGSSSSQSAPTSGTRPPRPAPSSQDQE